MNQSQRKRAIKRNRPKDKWYAKINKINITFQ